MRRNEMDLLSQPIRNLFTNPLCDTPGSATTFRTNLAQNPSFETTSGTVDVRTNLHINPAFEATSGMTDVRTNWIQNSSFAATGANVNVRTNYATNPAMETLNGTQTIRTNLATNPRMTNFNFGGYGTQTLSSVSTGVTGNPEGITTAVRTSYTAGATNPGIVVMPLPEVSTKYTISAWVYNEGPTAEDIALALKGSSSGGQQTVQPGTWVRLSWTMTTPASLGTGNDFGVRISVPTSTGSFLTTGVLIEKSGTLGYYFDGTTTTTNLTPNPSFATDISSWTTISSSLTRVTTKGDGAVGELSQTTANGARQAAIALFPFYQPVGTYTVSFDAATSEASLSQVRVLFYSPALVNTVHSGPITPVNLTAKDGTTFTRYSFTVTTTDTFDRIYIDFLGTAIPVGAKAWVDRVMVEKGTTSGSWYTGTGDFTFSWSGTANASSSTITAPKLLGFTNENGGTLYRDSMSQMTGTYSGKMLASSGDFYLTSATTTASAGWTLSLDYKTCGTLTGNPRLYIAGGGTAVTYNLPLTQLTPARFSVTLPATSSGVVQVVGAVFAATTGDFWVDNIMLESTPVSGSYFDGTTAASGDFTYTWAGTAHASVSYAQAPSIASWLPRWYGSTGGAGVFYQAKGGPSGTYGRKLWTQSNTGSSMDVGINTGNITAWASTTYTLSAWVRCSVDQSYQFYIDWKDSGGTLLTSSRPTQTALIPANTWTRLSITVTSPANTAMATFVLTPYNGATAMPAGATLDFDNAMAEIYPSVRDYFDAANPLKNLCTNPSFDTDTSGWTAAAVQAGHGRNVTRSWTGSASVWGVAVDPYGDSMYTNTVQYDVNEGATYTASAYVWVPTGVSATDFRDGVRNFWAVAAVNTVPSLVRSANIDFSKTNQWQRVSTTITIPAGSNKLNIRLYFPANGLGVYWDAILVEKTEFLNPYYAGQGGFTYAWAGPVNASSSLQQAPKPTTVGAANQAVVYQVGTTGKYKTRMSFIGNTIGDSGVNFGGGITTQPNKTYTVGLTITADSTRTFKFSAQGTGVIPSGSAAITATAGVPTRQVFSFTTAASGTYALYILRADTLLGNIDIQDMQVEEGTILNGGYFNGSRIDQNLITNPNFETDASGWWANSGNPTLTSSNETAFFGTRSLKAVSTVLGSDIAVTQNVTLKASSTYTISYWVYSPDARTSCYFDVAATNFNITRLGTTSVSASAWKKVSATFTTPENIVGSTAIYLHHSGGPNVLGAAVFIDAILCEESDWTNQFYEGAGDFTYAWTGTAHASTSVQRGTAVNRTTSQRAFGVSTTRDGDKVLRVIPSGKGPGTNAAYTGNDVFIELFGQIQPLKANTTYTLVATLQNEAPLSAGAKFRFNIDGNDQYSPTQQTTVGQYTVTWQFVTGANATVNFMRFMPGPSGVVGYTNEVLLKNLLIIEGAYVGPYFDGATTWANDYTYRWTGTANDSMSELRATPPLKIGWLNAIPATSTNWSSSGTKSVKVSPSGASTDSFAYLTIPPLENGKTYTIMATMRMTSPQTGTIDNRARRIDVFHSNGWTLGAQAPNVAGVSKVSCTFTVTDKNAYTNARLYNGASVGNGDVWYDDIMLVEGNYTGDFINPTQNPFAKWDGTANDSTSVGYPPQLLDIAGKPAAQLVGTTGDTGNILAPSAFSARTLYFVYEHTDANAAWQAPLYYARPSGGGAEGLVVQTSDIGSPYMYPRADFIGGTQNATTILPNGRGTAFRYVVAMSFPQGLASSTAMINGSADIQRVYDNTANGWTSGRLYAVTRIGIAHLHSMVFYQEHDRATKLALCRYLGNKYGAAVS